MRIGRHQTGAALLTAMLTVTLVATLAANAMWQHWRNVEAEAAERVRIQQAWLLAGALDWARALLRQDALNNQTDHLAEPWALPMPETRLAGLLADDKNDRISDDPSLDGYVSIRITDMQSRLNVNNLIEGEGHHISESGLIAFRRLFRLLDLPLSQLTLLAENLRLAGGPGKPPTPLRPNRIEELISLGLPPSTLDALQPFVALLPEQTPVNLNTASAEVIYASVPGLELGQAQRIVNARTAAHFRSPAMALQAAGVMAIPVDAVSLSVNSRYFQVHARLRQAASEMQGRWLLTRDESDVLALQHMRGAGLAAARAFQATGVHRPIRPPRLIVIPPPPPDAESAPVFAHLLAGDGPDTPLRHGPPASPPTASLLPGTETCVVVSARLLAWHHVALPPAIGRTLLSRHADPVRARAMLTGLLEEQLLDESASLHFAVFPGPQPKTSAWIAVCDRSWLQRALQPLETAGLRVTRIVPELAPPDGANLSPEVHVCGTEDAPYLHLSTSTGTCRLPWCAAAASLAAALPDARISAEPALLALAERIFNSPVEPRTAAARHLHAAGATWDLAQFDLAPSWRVRWLKPLARSWRDFTAAPRWRALRRGLSLLLLVHVVGIGTWAWQENVELARKRTAINGILLQTFPETGLIVDAPRQMLRSMEMLQQASGRDLAPALDRLLAAVFQANPAYSTVQEIEYVRGELRLRGPDLEAEAETTREMLQRLAESGLAARLEDGLLVVRHGANP